MVAGTKSDDVLVGDAGDNRLDGLDGNDRLSGLGGNDLLIGGAGADVLDGGDGIDLASYYTSAAGVAVNLASHSASGGEAQGDTLIGIEDLEGSDWNDTLTGNSDDNWLYGLDGNDRLMGGGGDDVLTGGAGADTLDGGAGYNAAFYAWSLAGVAVNLATGAAEGGDAQGDVLLQIANLIGSDFADLLGGDAGDNVLYGNDGADKLWGNDGDDILNGGAGADSLYGGAGYNAASYVGSSAGVAVNLATGAAEGGDAQGDLLYQITDLFGSNFADLLGGDAGDNVLYGNGGADKLWGNGGDDILRGGAGGDTLYGGAGENMASYLGSSAGVAVNLATGA
uniref:calcium-binding protein n=1 Tax=Inquilinus sp. TaxID=1932117 RepID=UPI0031DA33CE